MRKIKLEKGKVYLFEWNDTYGQTGWKDMEDIDASTVPVLQSSVGFFVKRTEDWYIIAMHHNTDLTFKEWGNVHWIPRGAVKSVTSIL